MDAGSRSPASDAAVAVWSRLGCPHRDGFCDCPLLIGEVKRALAWAEWHAMTPEARAKRYPPCLTCGHKATGEFKAGEPTYPCHHPARKIGPDVLVKAIARGLSAQW